MPSPECAPSRQRPPASLAALATAALLPGISLPRHRASCPPSPPCPLFLPPPRSNTYDLLNWRLSFSILGGGNFTWGPSDVDVTWSGTKVSWRPAWGRLGPSHLTCIQQAHAVLPHCAPSPPLPPHPTSLLSLPAPLPTTNAFVPAGQPGPQGVAEGDQGGGHPRHRLWRHGLGPHRGPVHPGGRAAGWLARTMWSAELEASPLPAVLCCQIGDRSHPPLQFIMLSSLLSPPLPSITDPAPD